MATDNNVQLTGKALEEYLASRFPVTPPTAEPELNTFSAEWFADQFADILCEVATGIPERDRQTAQNLMEGFELAIDQWLVYHEEMSLSYKSLHAQFLGINRDWRREAQISKTNL